MKNTIIAALSILLGLSSLQVQGQSTDAQGYVTNEKTNEGIEQVTLEGILQSDPTLRFNATTNINGFWQHININTPVHQIEGKKQDILDVQYSYGEIRFRITTDQPVRNGKIYNIAGQALYNIEFKQTGQNEYEAVWHKDSKLPLQILLFSDGIRTVKITPIAKSTGTTLHQKVTTAYATQNKLKSAHENEEETFLLKYRHENFQPLDTVGQFVKGEVNYFDVTMKAWPEYVFIINSKDGEGINLPNTTWQLNDPTTQNILFWGNTGSNALDTLRYIPKTIEEQERILITNKGGYEDWRRNITFKPGEVIIVSNNILKTYLYHTTVFGQDKGSNQDSLEVNMTDPNNGDELLASVESLENKTAILDFYKPGQYMDVNVEIKRKGYETQNNAEYLHRGSNYLVYALLANRFFGNITGEKQADGTPLDSLEVFIIDTLENDTLSHLFSGNETSIDYDFRKATEQLANKIEVKRQGYFTQTKIGVWIPGELNQIIQMPEEETGYFRAIIKPPLGYTMGRVIIKGLDVAHVDTGFIVGPLYHDFSNIPIDDDGVTQLRMYASTTTSPFLADSVDISIVKGDNGPKFVDVQLVPQEQSIRGNMTRGHTGGLIAQGGYDIVIRNNAGEVIDSLRVNGEEFLTKAIPENFEGNISVRFPIGDTQGRDTSYYGIYHAPLSIGDIRWPEDTLRTMNMRFTPTYMIDPYTGEEINTSAHHIKSMEGESFSVEYFKHNRENIYLDPNINETWYTNMMAHVERLIGEPIHENRVSTPIHITNEALLNYSIYNNDYKNEVGWNLTADGTGNVTYPKTSTNSELPIGMHLGGSINFSGDSIGFFKERIGRWLALNDVPSSSYISFMNDVKPSGWSIPDIHDRVNIKEYMENRKGLVQGHATYPLKYLRRSKDFN